MYIDSFAIHYRRTTSVFGLGSNPHKHIDRHQLIYPHNNIGRFAIDGSVHQYQPDHLFYAPAGMMHDCLNEIGTDYDLIYFTASNPVLLDALKILPYKLRLRNPDLVRYLFRQMQLLNLSNNPISRFHQFSYVTMLLAAETDKTLTLPFLDPSFSVPDLEFVKLQNTFNRLLGFISIHLHNITIDRMIQFSGYQSTHLFRLFKERLGTTPLHYVNHLRIEQSKALLEDVDIRISDIAATVGFSSPEAFTRAFKKEQGCSPSAYRARIRNKDIRESNI